MGGMQVRVSVWVPQSGEWCQVRSGMCKCFEATGLTCRRGCLLPPARGLWITHPVPVMSSIQSPDTEEGSAAISVEETEMPTSADGEAEASTVTTGEPALFMSTQEPEEGVSLVRCWEVEVMTGSSHSFLKGPIFILCSKSRRA